MSFISSVLVNGVGVGFMFETGNKCFEFFESLLSLSESDVEIVSLLAQLSDDLEGIGQCLGILLGGLRPGTGGVGHRQLFVDVDVLLPLPCSFLPLDILAFPIGEFDDSKRDVLRLFQQGHAPLEHQRDARWNDGKRFSGGVNDEG